MLTGSGVTVYYARNIHKFYSSTSYMHGYMYTLIHTVLFWLGTRYRTVN